MLKRHFYPVLCLLLTAVPLFSVLAARNSNLVQTDDELRQRVSSLIINEYLADPPAGSAGDANGDGTRDSSADELIELVNDGPVPLNIGLFTISDSTATRFTFPAGKVIPPGEAAVVFGGGAPTGEFGNAAANGLVFVAGSAGLSLNNGGDTITIKDNLSAVVTSLSFGASEGGAHQSITRAPDISGSLVPHSTAAGSEGRLFSPGTRINGSAFSTTAPVISAISPDATLLGIGDLTITITGSNFQSASIARVDGSIVSTTFQSSMTLSAIVPASITSLPGAHTVTVENPGSVASNNVTLTVLAAIGINEYLADPPDGPNGDANGDGIRDSSQDEFVELINRTELAQDVGGYSISDADGLRFTIPIGTMIPAGEVAVIFGGGLPAGEFGNAHSSGLVFTAPLSLNNSGDTIRLKDPLGAVVESIIFGTTQGNANQSITRSPESIGAFVTHSTAAGSAGRLFSPGTRADGNPFTAPHPTINSLTPNAAIAGGGETQITITGTHLQADSQVLVDGLPVVTQFQSATILHATIPDRVTSIPGRHSVTVENPGPLVSNALTFTVLGPVGINEYLADPPDGLAGDANGDGARDSSQDEFIEVINRTDSPVDISGYSISDTDSLRFTFPPGTVVPTGEVAVVFGGGLPAGEFGNAFVNGLVFTAALSLNNSGDTITLKDAASTSIESVTYGVIEGGANQSINRNPDASGFAFTPHASIAGSAGRLFSPGTRIDGRPFTVGPRITSINPASAKLGDPPFDITISGSAFDAGSKVFIDGQPVTAMFSSSDHLEAQVPATVLGARGSHRVQVHNEGGNRSNVVSLTIIPPPPSLDGIVPKFVIAGNGSFPLFAFGRDFDAGLSVVIDGTQLAATLTGVGVARATVPGTFSDKVGTHQVLVRNADSRQSTALSFEVIAPATAVASISPASVVAGTPGVGLSIRGANFKTNAVVLFDQIELATTFVSGSQLSAIVPAELISAVRVHAIAVQNPNEQLSNQISFQVLPDPPLMGSLDPPSVAAGTGDLIVIINGVKFQPGAVIRLIESTQPAGTLETTFISSDRLQTKVPGKLTIAPGSVVLAVQNPDFGFSNALALKVLIKDPLVINEYLADPPDGPAGDANGDGTRSSSADEFVEILNRSDEPIDISGFKLSDSDAIRHVFAPGTILPPFEAVVVFGGGTPKGAFGNAMENHLVFRASTGGLSLNNGGDKLVLQDAKGHIVQEIIFGALEGGSGQSINRDPDGGGTTFTLHTIVAADPTHLFSPGERVTKQAFTIKPVVSSLTPGSIRVGSPDFVLAVSGSNFLPGAVVLFGDKPLPTTYRSDTRIEARVTESLILEGGASEIRVKNPKGELSSSVRLLITDDPPRTAKITPGTTGTGALNLELSVSGERFQRGASVLIQGQAVETRFISSTGLISVAPGTLFQKAAELSVVILNADGNRSNGVTLTVDNGPLITRLSRGKIKAGSGEAEITVHGVAFKRGVVLFANDISVATAYVDDVSFTVRMPSEMTSHPGELIFQARNPDGGRSNRVTLRIID